MSEITKKSIFTPGGAKRTAGRTLEAGLDTASMGLLSTGKKLLTAGAKSVASEAPKLIPLIRQGAKEGMKTGTKYGAGYGLSESLKEEKSLHETAKNVMGSAAVGGVTGGVLGGGLPAAGAVARSAKNDVKTFFGPKPETKRVVYDFGVKGKQTLSDVAERAKNDMNENFRGLMPGVEKKSESAARVAVSRRPASVETTFDEKTYQLPGTMRSIGSALPRPGMSIEDVSGRPPLVPTNKNTREINAVNEKKNASAREAVASMMEKTRTKKPIDQKRVIPSEVFNTQEGANVFEELAQAKPGERQWVSTPDEIGSSGRVMGIKSTFPQWVPENLRRTPLFKEVTDALLDNTLPKSKPARRLYDIVHNEVRKRSGLPLYNFEKYDARKAPVANATPKQVSKTAAMPNGAGRHGNGMESDTSLSAFAKELDSIPAPWDEKPVQYNKYQQKAYTSKQDRIRSIGEVLNAPSILKTMGFTKKEAQKLGVKEAEVVSKLGKLGYPKDHPAVRDPYSEQTKKIIDLGVPYTRLKDYYEKKRALDTNILEGIDPSMLRDISPLQAGTRDVYRNFETVFGHGKYKNPTFQKVKKDLLDPFDAAKGEFITEQKAILADLEENIVKKLGIKKGSKLSAAIQLYGEGKMPLDELKAKFPKDWEKVVEADKWFRNKYDTMLDELNRVREYYYPTHPLYPESTKIIPKRKDYYHHFKEISDGFQGLKNIFDTPANIDPSLAVSSQYTKPLSRFLPFALQRKGEQTTNDAVGGFLDYAKAHSYAKYIDPHIQRFRGVDKETKALLPNQERTGLAEELSLKSDPARTIAESSDTNEIRALLKERGLDGRDAKRMAEELSRKNTILEVKEYLDNNLTEFGRSRFQPEALAEHSENKLNNFLKFLDNFANDLAGKTNPLDRPVQDNFLGRQAFRAINWMNSRVKANVILGNVGSALAQFFGIPNGIANAGVKNSTKAIGDSLVGIFNKTAPSAKSAFLNERYFNGYDSFDTGVINNTKKAAVWLTGIGDKIGTTFTWNGQYRKALENGLSGENAMKYADDWTRRMVAGRGIGEVPIMQKAKLMQIIAPFQLEVANQWRVFGDWARNDPQRLALAKKLMVYSVATWVMNRVAKEIRGNDVAFDPIQAMLDAYQSYQEEEDKTKGALLAGGRLAGEVLSNMPGGSVPASWYKEAGAKDVFGTGIDLPTREKLFGDKDPTRFGGGILASKALSDPLYMLVPPFGGRQIKQTIEGSKTLTKGYAENSSGKVMTPVDTGVANTVRGLLFGKNAIGEVQDYYDNNQTPLSEQQTELFKRSGGTDYFNAVMKRREAEAVQNKLRDARKAEVKKLMGERGGDHSSPEFGAPDKKETKTAALPGISSAMAASDDIANKVNTEELVPLADGSFFVESVGKYGTFFDTEEEARYGMAKSLLEKSKDTDFVDMGDYVLRKKKTGPNVSVSTLSPEEGRIEIAKSELEKSGEKFLDMGDTVLIKGAKEIREMSKDDFTITINDKRMNLAKDSKDFGTWMKTAEESARILQEKLMSGDLNELEQVEIDDKLGTLLRTAQKYSSYGGFTKAKKLPENLRYPIIDKEMIRASMPRIPSSKVRIARRPISLVPVRITSVQKRSRRRILTR